MPELPRSARGARRRYFEADGVDELLSMVLELTSEVATVRQRLYVTERVLEKHGLDVGRDIEGYELSEEDARHLAEDRERLLRTVTRTLECDAAPKDAASMGRKKTPPAGKQPGRAA